MAVEGFCVSFVIALILSLLIKEPPRELLQWPLWKMLLIGVIIAPIVETVMFQLLPILVVRALGGRFVVALISSVILFSMVHFVEGIIVGVSAGIISGFYLAYLFLHWVEESRWTAFWATTLSHMTRNGLAITLVILSKAI